MTDRLPVLDAKVKRLAEIIADGEPGKGQAGSVGAIRQAQAEAAREVVESGSSVAEVENVPLPTERV